MRTAFFEGIRPRPAWLAVVLGAWLALGGASALAAVQPHQQIGEFGSFSNPNGIAIDESNDDVYVADLGTDTVYRFDENGKPVDFSASGTYVKGSELTGTPAGAFSFPASAYGTPAAIAVDNSKSPSDPSAGDLYVMDAGHGVIDKFSANGEYLSQITGFTPATGSSQEGELLGLAVDTTGQLRVDLSQLIGKVAVDVFDDSSGSHLIAKQFNAKTSETRGAGVPEEMQEADGFAVGPTGDNYLLYKGCSCVAKLGQQLAALGRVENLEPESGVVAVAADPATGHVYVDDQAAIAEWDTGAMNGSDEGTQSTAFRPVGGGTLVGERFGSLGPGSSGQGGIAVNGVSGRIYVANPGADKVDVFASEPPAVTAGAANGVTKEAAILNGTVDPRGAAITKCEFEYGVADEWGAGAYEHKMSCEQTPAAIGIGVGAVPVSAAIAGMKAGLLYRFRLTAESAAGLRGESSGLFATLGEGFGVKKFEVSFLNRDGTPDSQAGSHPYKLVNTIEFNSHFQRVESNADSQYVREPDGTLKDLALDFPPGMVGDPNATAKKCTLKELRQGQGICAPEAFLGDWRVLYSEQLYYGDYLFDEPIYNIIPPRGVAVQLGVHYDLPDLFINNGLLAGGDYPIQATVTNPPASAPVLVSQVTVYGDPAEVQAERRQHEIENEVGHPVSLPSFTPKAFLTLPTGCDGPLRSTIATDSYQEPGRKVEKEEITRNSAGAPVFLTGCSKLQFPPEISVAPDSTNASTSSGLTVKVHVPQTAGFNADGLAESSLRDTTVTLPEGVALNPAGADGLEACTSEVGALGGALGSPGDQIGFLGADELNEEYEEGVEWDTFTPEMPSPLMPGQNFCPNGSKVGTVKIRTPLLEHELEGAVYLASQEANPFGSLIAMYIVAEDPYSGSLIKLAGEVSLNPDTGQIVTTFKNTPDLPFEELELHFFGGERAPLATPSRCGTYTTTAVFTPWDGNGPVTSESSFNIDHGPGGGPCVHPGQAQPFNPTVNAGATNNQAGAFSPLTVTVNRKDGEQDLKSIVAQLPPGLSGVLTGIELCPEPQANLGECGPNSLIGEATVSVGVGNQPFTVTGGKFYLTGPYNGSGGCTVGEAGCAPFGLTFVVPAKAGPFDLANTRSNHPRCDCVVVRGKIELSPITAAITITSDPPGSPDSIPTSIEGIPLEIQHVNATTTRGDFQFNPTNCSKMTLEGTVLLSEGGVSTISTPFQVTNCAALKFEPSFKVSTSGKTSRANGASLHVKLAYPKAPFGTQANIRSVHVELPKALPSRLSTLNHACLDSVFNQNPASCPSQSRVGFAKAVTPVLPVPLEGPAYFVSHGGQRFPELIVVLQGYGVTVYLQGETFISKAGITSSTFKTVPDVPVGSFELTLPEGPFSALAANTDLCTANLVMPNVFDAQNGAQIKQNTPLEVEGCPYALRIVHHRVKKRTLTLKVSVPVAGRLVASGKGVSKAAKTAKGRSTLTLTLKERHAGKLRTKIQLRFTPKGASGKQRGKGSKVLRKSLTVTFR